MTALYPPTLENTMKFVGQSLLLSAALVAFASAPTLAGGLAASSAAGGSSASSASMGSADKSSDSATKTMAEINGPYRIVEVTPMPERPGTLRVKLQAAASADDVVQIYVPQKTLERNGLGAGKMVTAHQRPYGVEFARTDTNQAFFLLLADDWHKELSSNPVTL